MRHLFLFLFALAAPAAVQGPRIFVQTDIEGVGGVCSWDEQTLPGQRRFEESRRLLIGEVNAAIEGAVEGGAGEVVVFDGHDGGRTLSIEDLHPRGMLIQDVHRPPHHYLGEDRYEGIMFVGQHAKAGAPGALLAHSQSLAIQNISINGRSVGEIGQIAALAGYFKIPVILLSGDRAACDELLSIQPTAETVAVKQLVGKDGALSLSHSEAREQIRRAARRAVERIREFSPWIVEGPVEMKFEYYPKATTTGEMKQDPPRVFRGRTVLEAFEAWRGK